MNKSELTRVLSFSRQIALGAGAILKKGFNHSLRVTYKGRIDPVTEFDLKAEKYIIDRIRKAYPSHGLLSEEGAARIDRAGYRWIVDPLDGTVNFAHGFPIYCVSVALHHEGEPLVGAVYDPERDEMFSAVRGGGAWLNGRKIHVSTEQRLERALLATGFAYDIGSARRNNLGLFARMAKKAQGIRRPGSAAMDLCWLASGRIDGFWELKLHPWDTAAAMLVVEEAGGRVSRLNGARYSVFDADLLASNGRLHNAMKRVLSP